MGFLVRLLQNPLMGLPLQARRTHRIFSVSCAAAVALLATSLNLLADTPDSLLSVSPGGCYCHCSESHARIGCVKMCDLAKYASRWWATSCAKSRLLAPSDKHGAGPRLPHPDRAEHAQNLPQANR